MHRRLLAVLTAGALLLGACGDDDSSTDDAYVDAMAASMRQDEDLPFAPDDVDCLAREFVGALGGAERLEADDITPEELRGDGGLEELGLELGRDEADGIAASFGS